MEILIRQEGSFHHIPHLSYSECSSASLRLFPLWRSSEMKSEFWIHFNWCLWRPGPGVWMSKRDVGVKRALGLKEGAIYDRGRVLHWWECSRPCRRGICIHPSTPRRPAKHCVWHSNRCRCCRVSWCARCGQLWHTAGPPCSLHTATPAQQTERENGNKSNEDWD